MKRKKFFRLVWVACVAIVLGNWQASAIAGGIGNRSTATCDAGLVINAVDPLDAAKAIDICKLSTGPDEWGLVSAAWVRADGSNLSGQANYDIGHGIFSAYGSNVSVRNGERLLALSSGTARRPTDPGYIAPAGGFSKGYSGNSPSGFPKTIISCIGGCPETGTVYDDVALAISLRVPWFANGFAFDFKFYTPDYPVYVCTLFNDWFVAILDPIPPGFPDGNIAFSPNGSPVRENDSLLRFCTPNEFADCYTCLDGTSELQGTGYENHAGSEWLTASASAVGGAQINLRFAVYDSGDGSYDSIALIDNFRWTEGPKVYLPLVTK